MVRKSFSMMLIGIGILTSTGSALAMDLKFTPRIGVGIEKYSLQFETYDATTGAKEAGDYFKVDEYMPTLTIGGTVALDRLYLDAYWKKSDTSGETYSVWGPFQNESYYANLYKANHEDIAVSLGYAFANTLEGLTVFAGYKYGKTHATGVYRYVETFRGGIEFMNSGKGLEQTTFETQGPFLGAGYGLHLGPGVLSLTGAWAFLSGDIKDKQPGITNASKPDADGFAVSLAWKAPITDQLSYSISVDGYQYNYDKKLLKGVDILTKAKEESMGVRAAIAYSF